VSELLRIATSGLIAQQAALDVTGHNISNTNVEGYSRQRVELVTPQPQLRVGAYFGRGVDLETVSRVVDQFLIAQLRADGSAFHQADTLRFFSEQIDAIVGDPNVGMSGRIEDFFDTLQTAADDPLYVPNRQVVLGSARTLASQFNELDQRLDALNDALNTQLAALTRELDALATEVAELNRKIVNNTSVSLNDRPNDLLDQRDRLIQQIATIVDLQVVPQGEELNLFLGKGQALVVGGTVFHAVTVPDRFDPAKLQLAVVLPDGPRIVSDEARGGKIGGLLAFRDQVLDPAYNALGRVALGIAADVNEQHRLGMDLEGELGGLVFTDVNDPEAARFRARAATDNDPASTGGARVFIDDPALLTTSTYQLDITGGGGWQLFRLSDNALVASGATLTDSLVSVDGFSIDLNLSEIPPGVFLAGDSFIIEPTRRGAESFGLVLARAEDLALAQPVRTANGSGNVGSGAIVPGATFDVTTPIFATGGALAPPLLIRFTSTTTFDVLDNSNPANPVALVPPLTGLAFTPGVRNTLFSTVSTDPDYFGFQVELQGAPVAGDSFAIGYNGGGVSDNRNARALAALQLANTLANGTATYSGAWGQLVGFVGTETRQARIDTQASQVVLEQSQGNRDEVSGVNLDEEAANLIRFEQAYNASAQVINVARAIIQSLFDALD
jgi:flagellar hook-associated protein 1 FlgK